MKLQLSNYKSIVVLTGAGISVASGLRPYRGPDGVWEEYKVAEYGHVDALNADPDKVWQLFGPLRDALVKAKPNAGHLALAAAQRQVARHQSFLLVTQNVDGLHQRAGSEGVAELHGNISRTRCSSPSCDYPVALDRASYAGAAAPRCPRCSSPLRPDIVLFGEAVDAAASWRAKRALRDCDLFIAIGTSGMVSPASNFVRSARYAGARTVYVNIDPEPGTEGFDELVIGRAEEELPRLFGLEHLTSSAAKQGA
jgi:NAD-dependent deacetylase